jgi:hypothetical protein
MDDKKHLLIIFMDTIADAKKLHIFIQSSWQPIADATV